MGARRVRVRQRVRRPTHRSRVHRTLPQPRSGRASKAIPTADRRAAAYRLLAGRFSGHVSNSAAMRLLRCAPESQRDRDIANVIAIYSRIIRNTCDRLNEELDDYQDHLRALKYMQRAGGSLSASLRCGWALGYLNAAKELVKELAPEPLQGTVDLVDVTKSLDYGAKVIAALSPVLKRYRKMDAMARADEANDAAARDLILEHETPAKLRTAANRVSSRSRAYWRYVVKTQRSLVRLSRQRSSAG